MSYIRKQPLHYGLNSRAGKFQLRVNITEIRYAIIFDICYGFSMALSLSENNQYFFNEINQSYSFSHLSDMYVFLSYIFCEKADGKKYVEEGLRLPKTESGGGRSFH